MSFGPELPPEELARRARIVNRLGAVVAVALTSIVLFGALIAPLIVE